MLTPESVCEPGWRHAATWWPVAMIKAPRRSLRWLMRYVPVDSSASSGRLPRGEVALQPFEREIHGNADGRDGNDPEVHVGDQEAVLRIDDQVAQSRLGA